MIVTTITTINPNIITTIKHRSFSSENLDLLK